MREFNYLLRLFGEGLCMEIENGEGSLLVHVENRDKSRHVDFCATDEVEAERIAKEWMLGQMLVGYEGLCELAVFLGNREMIRKEIGYDRG